MVQLSVAMSLLLDVMLVTRKENQEFSTFLFFSYAFVEYEDYRDASDAYQRLHGKPFQGGSIRIEWAKRGPDARRDRFDSRRERSGRSRSRSPRRNQESDDDRKADRSRSRSPSPNRSASPVRSPKMSDHEGSI